MKTAPLILTTLFAVFFFGSNSIRAEDTDIYSGLTGNNNIPNIMLVVDNAANSNAQMSSCTYWDGDVPTADATGDKSLDNYMCALDYVVHSMSTNPDGSALVKVGLTKQSGLFLELTPIDDNPYTGSFSGASGLTNREAVSLAIRALTTNSTTAAQGKSFQETWAYYTGGNGGTTNVGENSGTVYSGSKVAGGCQKNYIIFMSGVTSSAHSATVSSLTVLTDAVNNAFGAGSDKAIELLTPVTAGLGPEKGYGIEWARFMYKGDFNSTGTGDQNIITYSVAAGSPVYPASMGSWETYIYDTALYGGGKYFAATNYQDIVNSILKILNEVQAVNSVFASSSLPVSVNAQGTFLNQIYMGMFRPDSNGLPRWLGNLKQYQFGFDTLTQTLSLVDSTGQPAISNAGTGFISPNAISFWTKKDLTAEPDLSGGFWKNHSQGAGTTYDSPDGELVEKGGAAQVMRYANLNNDYATYPSSPRNLYTYFTNTDLTDSSNSIDTTNASVNDTLLGTGPRIISSITSQAKQVADRAYPINGGGGSPYVTITALSKAGSTVTATVSLTDIALLSPGTQLNIATGATKYDCSGNICTVITVDSTTGQFTYSNSGGNGTPTLPYVSYIYVKWFQMEVDAGHGLVSGQKVTVNDCTVYPAANGTIGAVQVFTNKIFRVALVFGKTYTSVDNTCTYVLNTATATTTTPHGLAQGSTVLIYGTGIPGYNGAQIVKVLNNTQFSYVYNSAAPLPDFSGTASMSAGSTTRAQLINWMRGYDNYGDEDSLCPPGTAAGTANCPNPLVTIRPSVHGDVLHSRPAVINYGGSTGVVVYYGANDGVFRAINGNQTDAIGSTPAGGELWGFVPPEYLGKFKRLHDNSPALQLPSTPWGIIPTPQRKDYEVDGASSVYQSQNADGTTNKAWIYLTMRRGGRWMYALDVTDPAAPQFLWRNYSNGDFTELGQTWSQPKVAFVRGYVDGGGVAKPVLIFGGGYGYPDDSEPPSAAVMGRGIFIVDAETGALVWKATYGVSSACSGTTTKASCTVAGMNYAIPSDITLLDHYGNDGYIDRLYVGDLGGNIWRVDLEPAAGNTPDHWKVTHLASLGCSSGPCAAGSTPRKFFYPPDVVPTGSYDAILIGSGDREHPLYSNGAYNKTNRFYMIKDYNVGNDGTDLNFNQGDLLNITNTSNPEVTTLPYDGTLDGFYITLGTGEKVVNAPLTVAGYTYFGTNTPAVPNANSCTTNLGTAKGYQINPLSGTSNYTIYDGGGLPPSPVAGSVIVNVNGTDEILPFCIGCGGSPDSNCKSALCGAKPQIDVSTARSRTYWYKESD